METADRILEARKQSGLSQSQLAERARVRQPNLSSYESGKVEPRPETLERILNATRERPSVVLARKRDEVLAAAAIRKATNVRVFGSIAHGTDHSESDVDLLVSFSDEASILDAAGLMLDLERILGRRVDVMSDRAEGAIRDRAVAESVPL